MSTDDSETSLSPAPAAASPRSDRKTTTALHDLLNAPSSLPDSALALATLLARYSASSNIISTTTGKTPLTLAVSLPLPRLASRRLITALLDSACASPTLPDAFHQTPAVAAIDANALHLLDIFCVAGVSPNAPPLLPRVLAASPSIPAPVRTRAIAAVLTFGATADTNALATALTHRRMSDAAILLAHGAPPTARDSAGNNAAHLACAAVAKTVAASPPPPEPFLRDALDVLGAVLAHGVAAAAPNAQGRTPVDLLRAVPPCVADRPQAPATKLVRRRPRQARRALREAHSLLQAAVLASERPFTNVRPGVVGATASFKAAVASRSSAPFDEAVVTARRERFARLRRRDNGTIEGKLDLQNCSLRRPLAAPPAARPRRAARPRVRSPGCLLIHTVASVESFAATGERVEAIERGAE
jgi:hypothetical protein